MFKKILLMLGLTVLSTVAHAQSPQPEPIPASLLVGGELVDVKNGFAFRVDQPNLKWGIQKQDAQGVMYLGVDASARAAYMVGVETKHYSEMTQDRAKEFLRGETFGLGQTGWTVNESAIEPTTVPRKNSYRANYVATNAQGVGMTFVTYVTSPDMLYSIQCVAAKVDEQACRNLAGGFRLLAPPAEEKAATGLSRTKVNAQEPGSAAPSSALTILYLFVDVFVYFAFLFIAIGWNKSAKRGDLKPRLVGSIAVLILVAMQIAYIKMHFINEEALASLSSFDQGYIVGRYYGIAMTPAILVFAIVGMVAWVKRKK